MYALNIADTNGFQFWVSGGRRGHYAVFMDSDLDFYHAKALLDWQVELGATEAICDAPIDRFDLPQSLPKAKPAVVKNDSVTIPEQPKIDPVKVARDLAAAASDLTALRSAVDSYPHCDLKRGAKNTVFADGNPGARVMIVGEAPGRDEDIQGLPFVGAAGKLLDQMFAAIDLGRQDPDPNASVYIMNIMPWRPPQNRDPNPQEIEMMMPFVKRHIELVQPEILVLMGNISCQALLGRKGITRLRGNWAELQNVPVMPMFHPAYLLRSPHAKRDAWNDLLMVKARLRTAGPVKF